MQRAGFQLTRYADDWLCVCQTREEAERALASARAVLEGQLGLRIHPEKTRIVHVALLTELTTEFRQVVDGVGGCPLACLRDH